MNDSTRTEENNNVNSFVGLEVVSAQTVFVGGETIMVNLQQYKTNMTGGIAGHANPPCEWGSKCLTVAASTKHGHARRLSTPRKKNTLRGMGGGDRGCSPWCRPRTAQHVASPPPYPHSCPGKNKRCPSTALNVAYPPPKNPPNVEWGGGTGGVHRGVAQEQH